MYLRKAVYLGFFLSIMVVLSSNSIAQFSTPAPVGLVSFYAAENNALDARSRRNGTLQNGTTYTGGKIGQAFSFDGVDDSIDLGTGFSDVGFSVSIWLNPSPTQVSFADIMDNNHSGGNNWVIQQDSNITNQYNYRGGIFTLTPNVWQHLAISQSSNGNFSIYVNGVQAASGNAPVSFDGNQFLRLGTWGGGGRNWNGKMDEFAYFNRPLSASEAQAIYNADFAGISKPTATNSPANLVGFWTSDGNANDIVSNNNGTLQNGAGFAVGKVGQAFSFDGNDDEVTVSNAPQINFASNQPMSVEFWAYRTSANGLQHFLGKRANCDGSPINYQFVYASNQIYFGAGAGNEASSGQDIPLNTWTHIAGTFDGTTFRIYINGVLSGTASGSLGGNSAPLIIGGSGTCAKFGGKIDEVSLFNRTLTSDEITSIFNAGIAGKTKQVTTISTANRAALWQAEGNGNDFTGVNNGTLFNGTSFVTGKIGRAFDFVRSSSQYVEIPDSPSLSPSTQITTAAWVKLAGDHDQSVIGKYGTSSVTVQNSFFHGFYVGRIFITCVYATGYYCRLANSPVPLNQWIHTAATFDTTTQEMKLFINGNEIPSTVSTSSSIPTINDSDTPVRISGNPESYPDDFDGQVDDATIYSRVLSPTEIQAMYNAGNGSLGDATVTFQNVTTSGITQQVPLDLTNFPSLPSGSTATGLAYDISTTAIYTGSPQVCFNLPSFTNSVDFNNLRILHLEGGIWQNRTDISSINFASKTICTTGLTSLSPFAIVNGFAPTAANASINGRVINANGRGINNVTLQLTNLATNEVFNVRSNNFGKYSFTDLEAGQTYILSVTAKRFSFTNPSRIITLSADLTDEDFVAN